MEYNHFFAMFIVISLVFIVIQGAFIFASYVYLVDRSFHFVKELYTSWSSGLISGIGLGSTVCSNLDSLISDNYPGSEKGCYCLNRFSRVGRDRICEGDVGLGDLRCSPIKATPSYNYFFWDGFQLCRNKTDVSYLDLDIKNTECSSGTRKCGIVDSLGNIICVENDIPCPINDIQFISKDSPVPVGYDFYDLKSSKLITQIKRQMGLFLLLAKSKKAHLVLMQEKQILDQVNIF